MRPASKPLVWLGGRIASPPFSDEARARAGRLLRRLQLGETLSLPHSRPLNDIGRRCHELRINDENATWRIVYRVDADAILIVEVFSKKTQTTPQWVMITSRQRLRAYDRATEER